MRCSDRRPSQLSLAVGEISAQLRLEIAPWRCWSLLEDRDLSWKQTLHWHLQSAPLQGHSLPWSAQTWPRVRYSWEQVQTHDPGWRAWPMSGGISASSWLHPIQWWPQKGKHLCWFWPFLKCQSWRQAPPITRVVAAPFCHQNRAELAPSP